MKHHKGLFDKVGIIASSLCMVHCFGTLLLALLLPAVGLALFTNESVHMILAFAVLGAGLFAFIPGYKLHRKAFILTAAITGMSFIIAPQVMPESYVTESLETGFTLFGGGLMIFTHWKNRVYCKICQEKPLSCISSCANCK